MDSTALELEVLARRGGVVPGLETGLIRYAPSPASAGSCVDGWLAMPEFLEMPLVPGSDPEIPSWVLAPPALILLQAAYNRRHSPANCGAYSYADHRANGTTIGE